MKYRQDPDLEFLKDCSSGELDILVNVLLQSSPPRDDRQSDSMSVRDYVQAASSGKRSRGMVQFPDHPLYKEHAPQHTLYWEIIAGEIQRQGVNQLALAARRGLGTLYIKILEHICGLFSVKYLRDSAAEILERELCTALFFRSIRHVQRGYLPVLWDAFALRPEDASIDAFMRTLVETMRLDDGPRHLLAMCVAHGSAMHAGNIGYKGLASEKRRVVLELLEGPLAAELSAVSPVSRTGVPYWLLVPAVLQVACLRTARHIEQA